MHALIMSFVIRGLLAIFTAVITYFLAFFLLKLALSLRNPKSEILRGGYFDHSVAKPGSKIGTQSASVV